MISSQRRRINPEVFRWQRFLVRNCPFSSIAAVEKPNTAIMKMLVDSYPEEVGQWAGPINNKCASVVQGDGRQAQVYDQKDLGIFAPDNYNGTTKIGRAYSQSLFCRLPSILTNTVFKGTHMEVDIKCCFTTMLTQLFRDVSTPTMEAYARNPEAVYNRMRTRLNLDKSATKKIINAIICSYPNVAQDPTVGDWAEISRDDMIVAMQYEVGLWAAKLRERYPLFFDMVSNKCLADHKPHHIDGTALFYAASDLEHSVMRRAIETLGLAADNFVWKYDGVLVPMRVLHGKTHEQWAADLQEAVAEDLDIEVQFAVKSLHDRSLGICFGPDEDDGRNGLTPYQRWRNDFETNKGFCKLENPPCFMKVFPDGGFVDLSKPDFQHLTSEEPDDFMKEYYRDPEKKIFKGRGHYPPGGEPLPSQYFNLYRGIAAARLPHNERPVDIDLYLQHVHNLMGCDDQCTSYMHKLIAQKIQYPGQKWRVMPIIMSTPGVGKDIWFDFLAKIVGDRQCLKVDGVHKLVGTNSGQLEGKLLCCFQEMGFRDTKDNEDYLKALITNKWLQVEQKYIVTRSLYSVIDFIGFTNNFGAIVPGPNDRRYFIVVANSTHAQDPAYIKPLLEFFEDERCVRAVYDYYIGLDVKDFDSSAERPITEAAKAAAENNISLLDHFFNKMLPAWKDGATQQDPDIRSRPHNTLRIKCGVVLSAFEEYTREMGVKHAENKKKMQSFFVTMKEELGGRTDKYITENHKKLVDNAKSNGTKFYDIDVRGLEAYLAITFDTTPGQEEPEVVTRGQLSAHSHRGRFQIKEAGEVVAVVDTLEEVNKELGEAYVETRFDESNAMHYQVLVHQFRGIEIPLGTEYMKEGGKARLEAKYPFYVRDRCVW